METSEMKLCLGCMNPIEDLSAPCPHCGFDPNTYQSNPRCMKMGTKLAGKYVIGKVIGEGGFGITYIGWDINLEMPIAIKEFFPPKIASRDATSGNNTIFVFDGANEKSFEDGVQRCVKEAKNMSKLHSLPGIVSIRDFFYENKTAYIIMEYVDGITLKEYMEQNGKMKANEVLGLMKPIMEALAHVHAAKIIHRDISPDNIMLQKDGQVKLIDFGAARVAQEDDEKSLTVMLKRGFSPEEQYRSKGHQGPWTDIYALCATVYYMMTGEKPPEAMERVLEDQYVSLGKFKLNIDNKVAKAIDKGLNIRAADRYQAMTELIYDIYGIEMKELNFTASDKSQKSLDGDETVLIEDTDATELIEDEEEFIPGKGIKRVKQYKKAPIIPIIIGAISIAVVIAIAFVVLGNRGEKVQEVKTEPQVIQVTASPTAISMVDLTNMTYEKAVEVMSALDSEMSITKRDDYSETVAKGYVISQSIIKDTPIEIGTAQSLELVISIGPPLVATPYLIKWTKAKALSKLKKLKLNGKTTEKYSSKIAKGKVISQSIKASKKVEIGTTVTLVISKGKKPVVATPRPTSRPSSQSKPSATKKPSSNSGGGVKADDNGMVNIEL